MVLLTVLIALVVAVVGGATVALVLGRHLARRGEAEREAARAEREAERRAEHDVAVEAARAALNQAVADRDAALHRAVDTAVSVAGDKFRDQLQAGSRELDLRSEAFEQRVGSLGERLDRMTELVSNLEHQRAEQHGQVVEGLEQAARNHAALADTTQQLRQALASPKARGQWGERMADDVLRLSGLIEGVNYRKQVTLAGGTVPDFTFLMPEDLELNMDVKFPVDNYLRYLETDHDAERDTHRKAFLARRAPADQGDHHPRLHRGRPHRQLRAAVHPQREHLLVHPRARSRADRPRARLPGRAVLPLHPLRGAGGHPPVHRQLRAPADLRRDPRVPRRVPGGVGEVRRPARQGGQAVRHRTQEPRDPLGHPTSGARAPPRPRRRPAQPPGATRRPVPGMMTSTTMSPSTTARRPRWVPTARCVTSDG
ncbi:MAG: DNA recombination protein RmuC [Acidimicrobiia bacterium]|nr:DNA recombination protein RmuC [Acidimicrobiia bacterium]